MTTGRPIRVLHAVLSMDMGGLEKIVVDLVRFTRRDGVLSSVCCVEKPGQLARTLTEEGTQVHSLQKSSGLRPWTVMRAAKLCRKVRPDVVHTHQVGALTYMGPGARLAGVPVIVHTEHGKHFLQSKKRRILARFAAHYADHVFTVSSDIGREGFAAGTFRPEKTSTVLNGIDVETFGRRLDTTMLRKSLDLDGADFVLGTVARLDPIKDQGTMLDAFARVRATQPGAHLVLVGDGPCREELHQRSQSLGLTRAVHFVGSQDDVVPYLNLMDVFVLSSRSEGVPLVVLEAMAAGVPVVSTSVGGLPEIVQDGRSGMLVPAGDAGQLAETILRLLVDGDLRKSVGEAARQSARERFSLGRMAEDYRREYVRLLTAKGVGL